MTYGGTRPWALWVDTGSGMAKNLYSPGYLYKTEKNAAGGLQRLIDSGDVILVDGVPRTRYMLLRVSVGPISRRDGS